MKLAIQTIQEETSELVVGPFSDRLFANITEGPKSDSPAEGRNMHAETSWSVVATAECPKGHRAQLFVQYASIGSETTK